MNLKYTDISVKIRIQSEKVENISLENSYFGFVTEDVGNCDVIITTHGNIPVELLAESNLLFEGKEHDLKYFSIFKHDNGYKFIVYNQDQDNEIQQIALLDENLREWNVYFKNSNNEIDKYPLMYPMGPLVFYYLTVKYNAIMIHASGVFDGEAGRLFTGVSGVGKSTMANIWRNSGSLILNDDRLIIRKEGADFFMYNTPMCYVDTNKRAKLNCIYTIKHASINTLEPLIGVKAVSRLMAFCIQHNYKQSFIEHHIDFISDLCSNISVSEIGFVPNNSIINFIKSHGG